jgi:hypothetical protein
MSAGGLKRIRTNLAGLALMERPPAGKPRLTATSPLRRLEGVELHEFKRLVRFELNGRR